MPKRTGDYRTRITRMLIRKAFMELLRQKPIQSISIKELCTLAGINRGTFYSHYTDIYDLLRQIEEEMLAEFEKALAPLLETQGHSCRPVDISTGIFQCLKDNSDLCTVTLGDYGDKAFALRLLNMGREKCMASYLKYFKNASPQLIEYYYAFVSSGCIGLLQKWLDEGMTLSASQMAQMAEGMMQSGLGIFLTEADQTK